MYAYRRSWKLAIKAAADRGIQGREVCGGGITVSNVAIRPNIVDKGLLSTIFDTAKCIQRGSRDRGKQQKKRGYGDSSTGRVTM